MFRTVLSRRALVCCGFALLAVNRLQAKEVCNAGYPGENSAQVLRRLPGALASCHSADTVVVFVGMNDAANPARFMAPEATRSNVSQMLQIIAAAHARALVVTVHIPDLVRLLQRHTPEEYGDRSPQQRVDDTDTGLTQAAQSAHARLVDFRMVLSAAGGANTSFSTDGVHLTREGYRLLASSVAKALPKDVTKVLCIGDSLTYGIGVRAPGAPDTGGASYPQQLQTMLNRAL